VKDLEVVLEAAKVGAGVVGGVLEDGVEEEVL
jgi:hypothetical protein